MIKTALIIDKNYISKWQADCLEYSKDLINIKLILNCQNTYNQKKFFKNYLYYLINIFFIRSKYTKKIRYNNINEELVINFNSTYDRNWQSIPLNIYQELKKNNINLIIKFGMNLIKIPKEYETLPIISFHHGDPSKFRGRPAGFYELFYNELNVGTIVQILNNKIDKGDVLSLSYFPVYNYSYSRTLKLVFKNSKILLRKAIINLNKSKKIHLKKAKQIYTLPSNFTVCKFLIKLLYNYTQRIIYGIFYEKKWNFSISKHFDLSNVLESENYIFTVDRQIEINHKYSFYADPFFRNEKQVFLEAFNKKNFRGEIIKYDLVNRSYKNILNNKKKHYSYPSYFKHNNIEFILPEVASWSPPFLYSLNDNKKKYLKGFEDNNLIDPTHFFHKDIHYIFAGKKEDSLYNLYLFYSVDSIYGPYKNHPLNPIVTNPLNARMGGKIIKFNNKIYRIGQNATVNYGDGVYLNNINVINKENYSENIITKINIKGYSGPHTLNFSNNGVVFDYYKNEFNFLAWYNRIRTKLN